MRAGRIGGIRRPGTLGRLEMGHGRRPYQAGPDTADGRVRLGKLGVRAFLEGAAADQLPAIVVQVDLPFSELLQLQASSVSGSPSLNRMTALTSGTFRSGLTS
ncbi:hypothetical protein [Streptomyces sp. MS1.AVA.4]|uniref:Uncharacterized protein n=1 Tax=Streptomyces pratisoli TaxID=3139917 RepID=A0ACC6QV24_9ACTN